MTPVEKLVQRVKFLRDSTFRDAASLRAIADDALNEYALTQADEDTQWTITDAGRALIAGTD